MIGHRLKDKSASLPRRLRTQRLRPVNAAALNYSSLLKIAWSVLRSWRWVNFWNDSPAWR